MKSARWFISYLVVAFVGLGLAFTFSLRFLAPAQSQNSPPSSKLEAPSAADLPAEFLNEVKNTQVPAAATAPTPAATPPPADAVAPAPGTSPVEATASEPVSSSGTPSEEYVYDPTGRRDPFVPHLLIPSLQKQTILEKQPSVDPLQRWELERFKVIGILWEVKSPRAMLRDPDGAVYTVVKNTKVGRNNGYVAAIREGEVVVVETTEYEGTKNKETKILELGK